MPKKILSIDGGGIKGVFPAAFLAVIEDSIGEKVADYFDLIVGTSTGGIIALGLGLGLSAKEILEFYEKFGPGIFYGNRLAKAIRWLGLSKYSNTNLEAALKNTFGDAKLGESKNRLVIPALNLENGEVYIYKTSHHPKFERDYKERMVEVALSTSAAPTFFPTYTIEAGTPMLDGGLWANNPIGLAVVEAIGVLNWSSDSLQVLSVGCTTEPLKVKWAKTRGLGVLYWASKLADVFMTSQSSASLGTAYTLTSHDAIFRFSPIVSRGTFSLDSAADIVSLKGLGASEARKAIPHIRHFFVEKAEPFVPYRNP